MTLALAACSHASVTTPRLDNSAIKSISNSTSSGKYVKFPVIHSTNRDVFADVWAKRGIQTVPLANRSDVAYYARLEIGNPPQPNYVQLDTGSFELWVNPDCSSLQGASDVQFCKAVGSYNPSSSSSAVVTQGTKTLRYGIGSADIQYVTDDIGFSEGNSPLKNVQFGVALATVDEFSGILGIGHGENVTIRYKNFIDELEDQGVTDTKAFSLALGSKNEQEGVVIFGGLDTGKFTGTLQKQPIIPAKEAPDGVPRYWIDMDFMSLTPPSGQTKKFANTTMAVFLDSGATLTLLPQTLADAIGADFGADGTDSSGFYKVDCGLNDLNGTVDFAFSGVTIHVPYSEMIREIQTSFGTQCYLGITPNEDFVLLGDTMLRSAYAVFDQSSDAIYLAQYVNCGTEEVEITTTTDIAQIKGKCGAPSFMTTTSTTVSESTSSSSATATVTAAATAGGSSVVAASSTPTASNAISSIGAVSIYWLSIGMAMAVSLGLAGVV
ncbi:aspartic peptidase domain-containing protein [Pseudomassariella vexata]|uniref:Aspartic peptidase domain-containing protein n=1 Tax=Pseudomassariella vexata TaxID=1141098 RepID=A0A1Y2DW13_9PEZI|nr:aspartic peptidase domain-containing protein [Pseudomassariella vexata]ORY63480.1 aspartic peptidase domain-containing protein [Pseudomassariella vexata]